MSRHAPACKAFLYPGIAECSCGATKAAQAETALVCITCKQPILVTDEWSWLDGNRREPEHDSCYQLRFARQFPSAANSRDTERTE